MDREDMNIKDNQIILEDFKSDEEEIEAQKLLSDNQKVVKEKSAKYSKSQMRAKAEKQIPLMKKHWDPIYEESKKDWKMYNLDQWTDDQKTARGKRPMHTYDFCRPFVKQIIAETFKNPTMIELKHRETKNAGGETVKLLSQAIRYIETYSNSSDAKSHATECAVVGGFGWIKVNYDLTSSENGKDEPLVTIDKVADPFSIYVDDKSTAINGEDITYAVEYIGKEHYNFYYKDSNDIVTWLEVKDGVNIAVGDYPARYIPIVPMFGEISFIDGETNLFGIIRQVTDQQRDYNYLQTDILERTALTPIIPLMVSEGSLEPDQERLLKASASTPTMMIKYKSNDIDGTPIPSPLNLPNTPNVAFADPMLSRMRDSAQASTGITPALPQSGIPQSGIAIGKINENSDRGQLVYDAHLKMTNKQIGKILLDLIQNVVTINNTITVQDDKQMNSVIRIGPQLNPNVKSIDNIDVNRSDIVITTQPAFATRNEEGMAKIYELVNKTAPTEMVKILPELIENSNLPGADRYARLLRGENVNDPNDPMIQLQQARAQMQQMNEQMQAMQQQGQELFKANQALQVEVKTNSEAMLAKARIDNSTKLDINNAKILSEERLATIELKMKDRWHNGDLTSDYNSELNKATIAQNKLNADADKQNKDIAAKAIENINNEANVLQTSIADDFYNETQFAPPIEPNNYQFGPME